MARTRTARALAVAAATLGGGLTVGQPRTASLEWAAVLLLVGAVGWVLTWRPSPARNHDVAVPAAVAGLVLAALIGVASAGIDRGSLLLWGTAVLAWTAALSFLEERDLVVGHGASGTAAALALLTGTAGLLVSSAPASQLLQHLGTVGLAVAAATVLRVDDVTGRTD